MSACIELLSAVNGAICSLAACEVALADVNQKIPPRSVYDISSCNGIEGSLVYFGVGNTLEQVREQLEKALSIEDMKAFETNKEA